MEMVLRYYDRTVDERPCLDYYVRGGFCIALMVNEDGTTQEVKYDDLEYDSSRRIGEPKIDASEEVIEKVRRVRLLGKTPRNSADIYKRVRAGDVVEVVKGRKYPKGTRITVKASYPFLIDKGHKFVEMYYLLGTNGEKISAENTIIVGFSD